MKLWQFSDHGGKWHYKNAASVSINEQGDLCGWDENEKLIWAVRQNAWVFVESPEETTKPTTAN